MDKMDKMGEIEINAVGGIGVAVSDKIADILIGRNVFPRDDWEDDPEDCMSQIEKETGIVIANANKYDEDFGINFYLMVPGGKLEEINNNASEFLDKLRGVGIYLTIDDLSVIADYSEL